MLKSSENNGRPLKAICKRNQVDKKSAGIIIYPFSEENPYQTLLANSLERLGYRVDRRARVDKTIPFFFMRMCQRKDILHLHWISGCYEGKTRLRFRIRTLLFCFVLLFLRMKGVRLVLTLHNLIPHEARYKSYHIWSTRLISMCVQSIIVHSMPAKEVAIRHFGCRNKFNVILHGHYVHYYSNHVSRDDARSFLQIPQNRKLILCFGMMRPYKGLEQLLKIAREIAEKDLMFLIVGYCREGYLKSLKQDLPSNTVLRAEFVPDDLIQYYMKAADCLILPYQESLTSGIAVLGLSFGLPIIGTNTISLKHLVYENLCVEFNLTDRISLTTAIERVLSWNRADFSKRCESFLRKCSWENIANEHLQAYGLGKVNQPSRYRTPFEA